MPIRPEAARKLAEDLLPRAFSRVELTDAILDMMARRIQTAVRIDEQRERMGLNADGHAEPKNQHVSILTRESALTAGAANGPVPYRTDS